MLRFPVADRALAPRATGRRIPWAVSLACALLLILWCLVPIAVLAYHYGPGQTALKRDRAAQFLAQAQAAEKGGHWTSALDLYTRALETLPASDVEPRWRLQLAQNKARMFSGQLPEAMIHLETLLGDLLKAGAPPALVREVRAEAGTAQYYTAWLMRLEGATTEEWTPEVEQARQHFRLLAEESQTSLSVDRIPDFQKNLEAVVRLARMDLSELQGLPLPKQCEGCKNASQKSRSQRESQARQAGEQKEERKDARDAGAGKRPDGTGS